MNEKLRRIRAFVEEMTKKPTLSARDQERIEQIFLIVEHESSKYQLSRVGEAKGE